MFKTIYKTICDWIYRTGEYLFKPERWRYLRPVSVTIRIKINEDFISVESPWTVLKSMKHLISTYKYSGPTCLETEYYVYLTN